MKLTNDTRNSTLGYAPNENDEWRPDNFSSQANVSPITVSGNTVKWPNDGAWYEAQSSSTHETIAEGFDGATLPPGVYTVINHRTGERHEGIRVDGGKDAPSWHALAGSPTSTESLVQRLNESSQVSGNSLFNVAQELPRASQPFTSSSDSTGASARSVANTDFGSNENPFGASIGDTQEPIVLAQVGGLESIAWDRIMSEVPETQAVDAVESVLGNGTNEPLTQEQINNMTPFDVVQHWMGGNGGHLDFGPDSQMAQIFSEGRGADYFEHHVVGDFGSHPPAGDLMDNFDYRGTWGRAATNVFGLDSQEFNPAEFYIGSWEDGVATSDGVSTNFTVNNRMGWNSLVFGRQINEAFGVEIFGPRASDLTMTISWNKPHQYPLTAPVSSGSDPQIPMPVTTTANNDDGSSTYTVHNNDGSRTSITHNTNRTTTIQQSTPDTTAASSPTTNVSTTYSSDGSEVISTQTTVTSPTGGTYEASTNSQPANHTSSADEAQANNNNSSNSNSTDTNNNDDYDDYADSFDDVDDWGF